MKLHSIVLLEIFERKNQVLTSFLAIFLGISVIVSIKNITYFSEKAVARELDALGANILILPKSASIQNYYNADMQGDVFPEEYVTRLSTSDLQGLDNLSPKLSLPIQLSGKNFILTGILPKNEFQAKAAWQGAGIFSRPQGCGTIAELPGSEKPVAKETLVRKRVIDTLDESSILVGADMASVLTLKEGDSLKLLDKEFKIIGILPTTGTIDDSRAFAHLHTIQKLSNKGTVVNAIEVVGCCEQISKGLVQKINTLLPEAKVVTITQIVDTQINTNHMMARLSLLFLAIIVLVGGASIANYMYANVYERRREIGTLMALGAGSKIVLRLFLMKALILGLSGGIFGYIFGTILAVFLGPWIAGVPVLPMPSLIIWALGLAIFISLVASYFPARQASKLDPCTALQEV
ncbi:MAG: ABC transporter permease [Candidatus Riflebacteria bacterium]|nr:ABC transporter permease [Candidatus Riflebacteria bacterium]